MKLNINLRGLDPTLEKEECNGLRKSITEVEGLIDKEVYKLYQLTSKEIKIIENQQ